MNTSKKVLLQLQKSQLFGTLMSGTLSCTLQLGNQSKIMFGKICNIAHANNIAQTSDVTYHLICYSTEDHCMDNLTTKT